MADPRNIDDRSNFFETEAANRTNTRPRITYAERQRRSREISLERERRSEVGYAIWEAAIAKKQVMISYTKITEDYATRIWIVEPYSYRHRMLNADKRWKPPILKKVFYGYDVEANQIKMFMYGNIHEAAVTETSFDPRWEVEITSAPHLPFGRFNIRGPEGPEG